MKPYQSLLTTLVILQVVSVLLLGAMAFLNYQNQSAVSQLREDVSDFQEAWKDQADAPLNERIAAMESRLGMRDPKADQTAAALEQQMAESNALQERFNQLRSLPAPTASGQMPPGFSKPPGMASGPAPAPAPALPSPLEGLDPAQQAIAQLPVAAEISNYDQTWEFYTINKGQIDGITRDQEFAVRQKDNYTLLANVKVTSLQPEDAIVEVVRSTANPNAPKPATGDVLVDISKLK